MHRLSIGRLIAVVFAVTVVLLFSIDTTVACRFLWRQRCYRPVYYCPPACEVVTYSSCDSVVIHGDAEVIHGESVKKPAARSGTAPVPEPPSNETPSDTAETIPDNDLPDSDLATPTDAAEIVEDDIIVAPGDEPTDPLATPADSGDDLLDLFDETPSDAGSDLPDMNEDSGDLFTDPLPDDNPAGGDDLLPGDDTDLPADADLPGDTPADDDLDDLFSDTAPAGDGEARVANNPEEEADELIDSIEADDPTNLPADADIPDDLFPADDPKDLPADADVPDDLFPADDSEAAPADGGDGADENLDDLFSQATPEATKGEALGFREVDRGALEPKIGKTVEQAKAQALYRVWTDNTGSYRTVGQLVKISDTHVRLLKDNGRYSTVPKRRLSQNDLAYVQRMAKQMGIEVIEKIARR